MNDQIGDLLYGLIYREGDTEGQAVIEQIQHSTNSVDFKFWHGLEEVDLTQEHSREDGGSQVHNFEDKLIFLSYENLKRI